MTIDLERRLIYAAGPAKTQKGLKKPMRSVKDPDKLEFLAEYRAKKASFSLIADAMQINENTLKSWSRTKAFKLLYAKKVLELLVKLTGKNIDSDNPKDAQWLLERMFREEYAPPTQKNEVGGDLKVSLVMKLPEGE